MVRTAVVGLLAMVVFPEYVAIAAGAIERAPDHKEQVGQSVEILARVVGNCFIVPQMNDRTLGAAADRP